MTQQVYNGLKKDHGIIKEYVVTCSGIPLKTTSNMDEKITLILYVYWRHITNII